MKDVCVKDRLMKLYRKSQRIVMEIKNSWTERLTKNFSMFGDSSRKNVNKEERES